MSNSTTGLFQFVRRIQERYQNELMNKRNVVGVAMGYKNSDDHQDPAVVVLVEEKKPVSSLNQTDIIPREIDGVRTDVIEVGRLVALGQFDGDAQSTPHLQASPRERHRPLIPAGVSAGHYLVTSGTLGAVVRDRATGQRLLLSNNHVFANSNEGNYGDFILQPGKLDGGQNPNDKVATLERFLALAYLEGDVKPAIPAQSVAVKPQSKSGIQALIDFIMSMIAPKPAPTVPTVPSVIMPANMDNVADAALARPIDAEAFSRQIRGIGNIRKSAPPTLGMNIRKTGRTTDTTQSTVTLLNATVNVAYNTTKGIRNARFVGQVICNAFSQGGDSGALVVDAESQTAVGLLFAGSGIASIFTPIDVVLDTLKVDLEVS
jgi:hypothetical protein